MIQRNCLRCVSCKSLITTRFGVGHGTKQVHAFPCPKCGVPITCVMRLDQEKVNVAFDDPINAEWVAPMTPAPYFVTFHPEILAPRKAFETDGMSPFTASIHYFSNPFEFGQHEAHRTRIRTEYWQTITRAVVHYEREQWDLLEPEIDLVLDEELEETYEGRVRQIFECFQYSLQWFTSDRRDIWRTAANQFDNAKTKHPSSLDAFAETFRSSGRLLSLWRQMTALHDEMIEKYPTWMPILQLQYWSTRPASLDALVVSDKRFDELKPIYLAAFELLARLSVIALGVELIGASGGSDVPTKKGSLSIWDFETLDNANKGPHLAKFSATQHFVALLDTKLRNGIGHNAAHYDISTDEVVCVKTKGASLHEWRISYTEFCHTMLELCSAVFFSEVYVRELLKRTTGLKP